MIAVYVATLAVFVMLEVSIRGGYRTVVFPNGFNPDDPRQAAIAEALPLAHTVVSRHLFWVADVVRGDLGRSSGRRGPFVADLIVDKAPISIELALVGMFLAVTLGVTLGLLAAASERRAGPLRIVFGLSQSVPTFLVGTFAIGFFAVRAGWLPSSGWVRPTNSVPEHLRFLVLPALSLAFAEIGIIAQIVRRSVRETATEEFVVMAMAKGLPKWTVLTRHVLRPASASLTNVIGLNVSALLSGSFIIEIVFAIGGLGQEFIDASLQRDLFLLVALVGYTVLLYRLIMSLVDAFVFWADPRIATEG